MTYSLKRLKIQSINVFFDLRSSSTARLNNQELEMRALLYGIAADSIRETREGLTDTMRQGAKEVHEIHSTHLKECMDIVRQGAKEILEIQSTHLKESASLVKRSLMGRLAD